MLRALYSYSQISREIIEMDAKHSAMEVIKEASPWQRIIIVPLKVGGQGTGTGLSHPRKNGEAHNSGIAHARTRRLAYGRGVHVDRFP